MKRILQITGILVLIGLAVGAVALFIDWRVNTLVHERLKAWPWYGQETVWPTFTPAVPPRYEPTAIPPTPRGPLPIATALLPTAVPYPTPTPAPLIIQPGPTGVPDYQPGQGMAVLTGSSPFTVSILPGGWQAYLIGPSENPWGYALDITPLVPAVNGAHIEYRILPEYNGTRWVDVLWLRSPEIQEALPVEIAVLPTTGWKVTWEADIRLTAGEWMGMGLYPARETCGGVMDISPDDIGQAANPAWIVQTRLVPEFPGEWIYVQRVMLSQGASPQPAHLSYACPLEKAAELMSFDAELPGGSWSGWGVAPSDVRQAYLVEVVPLEPVDNEVAEAIVQAEFDGRQWNDILRIRVPSGRPTLPVHVRVLAVPLP